MPIALFSDEEVCFSTSKEIVMYDILNRKSEGLKGQLVAFARQLVQTASLSLQEAQVARLVQDQMKALGYDRVFTDEAGNVVGIMLGREAEPTMLLNCHMDTMPAEAETAWQGSPYAGDIREGKLCGLGASDCKGGLAAQVYAGALLKRSLLPLKGNLVVAATVGEEKSCSAGVRTLIEKTLPSLKLKPTWAMLGEPTNLGLYYGHDGWAELEVLVEGANMFSVDDAAQAIFHDFNGRGRKTTDCKQDLAASPPRFEMEGGFRRASIGLNRRLSDAEDVGGVLEQVKHQAALVAQSAGDVAVKVLVREQNHRLYTGKTTVVRHITHAWSIDPFHPLMERARQTLSAAGCQVRPGKWRLGQAGMATAGGVLTASTIFPRSAMALATRLSSMPPMNTSRRPTSLRPPMEQRRLCTA
jgi:acetylornithine deacetylase/succinyl-diaminopimelate desuccinylase-like protein